VARKWPQIRPFACLERNAPRKLLPLSHATRWKSRILHHLKPDFSPQASATGNGTHHFSSIGAANFLSHRPNVILARQLPHPARHLQFEQSRKYLRGSKLRLKEVEDLVDLQTLVSA
jgi:hypothetical protein